MTAYHINRGYFGGMVYAESEHNICFNSLFVDLMCKFCDKFAEIKN